MLHRERACRSQILIDTGSERCVDMTYTSAADIYVGDVSSQVCEFLETPRPCVFLNAHQIDWQNNPDFAHWHFGDVVDDPRFRTHSQKKTVGHLS